MKTFSLGTWLGISAFALMLLAGTGCEKDNADSGGGDGGGNGGGGGGGSVVVTQSEYDQIQIGMSYSQVVAIIGAQGRLIDSSNGGDGRIYQWDNNVGSRDPNNLPSSVIVGFIFYNRPGGEVHAKADNGPLP